MDGQLGSLVVSLAADISRFQSDMGKATKEAQKTANDINVAFTTGMNGAKRALGALGIGLSTAGLVAMAKHSLEVSDNISKAAQKIGIATAELSALRYAAQLADVDFESLVSGMAKFNKNIVEGAAGATKQAEAFKLLGISNKELKTNSPDQLFDKMATQFQGMEDGAGKTALAMALLGKAGANMIPLLNSGAEGIKQAREEAAKFGLIISTETGKQAEEFNDNLTRLKNGFQGVVNQVMTRNLPMMEKLSSGMIATAKDADAVKRAADSIAAGFKLMASTGALAVGMFQVAGDNIASVAAAMTFAAEGEFKKAWEVLGHGGEDTVGDMKKTADRIKGIWAAAAKEAKETAENVGGDSNQPAPFLTGELGKSDWTAAHNKYLEYQNAFEETRAGIIKNAAARDLEINQQAYDMGLTDYRTYLETKHALTEEALFADVDAKRTELANARDALSHLKPVIDNKGKGNPSKDAENYHAALKTEQVAIKALNDAESKLTLERQKGADEADRMTSDIVAGYKEQQAALLDFQGDFVKAAEIRKKLDEDDSERWKLISAAMLGDKEAQAAYWAAEEQDANKSAEAVYKQTLEYNNLAIQLMELAGEYEKAAKARQKLEQSDPVFKLLPQDVQDQQNKLSAQAIAQGKAKDDEINIWNPAHNQQNAIGGDNYGSQLGRIREEYEKEKNLAQSQYDSMLISKEAFNQKMLEADKLYAAEKQSLGLSMASDAIGVLKQSFADNKAAMVAAMVVEKAIAIARIMVNTEVAASAAIAAAASIPLIGLEMGAANAAAIRSMGYVSMGIVAASGAIEGMQIAGKKAAGGAVASGSTYLVGEKGPELFTPGASGMITPNHALNQGGVVVNQYNTFDNRGADEGAVQRMNAALKQNKEETKAEIISSMNRGGSFALASGRMSR